MYAILKDGSRSLGLFWKGKTCIIAKLHSTGLVTCICNPSREGKTSSYIHINMVKTEERHLVKIAIKTVVC